MSFNASYRPPPPAPSAFFAMHLAQSAVPTTTPTTTPSTYLPRIPSKLSVNVTSGSAAQIPLTTGAQTGQTASASRNNSASSITALPSLSSSLNNLHRATSIEHVELVGTRTAEADELLRRVIQGNVKRLSNPSLGPMPGSDAVERSFPQYSDDSESEDDADEEEDSYFHQSIRKIDQSRQNQSPNSAGSTPPTRLNQGSGAGRSGLVMNRSRKDRLASHVSSAATFAF